MVKQVAMRIETRYNALVRSKNILKASHKVKHTNISHR